MFNESIGKAQLLFQTGEIYVSIPAGGSDITQTEVTDLLLSLLKLWLMTQFCSFLPLAPKQPVRFLFAPLATEPQLM